MPKKNALEAFMAWSVRLTASKSGSYFASRTKKLLHQHILPPEHMQSCAFHLMVRCASTHRTPASC